jgi:hypothetical protein
MAVGFPAKTTFVTGEVLTATAVNDITGTLNLLQSTLYPAGRNKIINGDFRINQRAFTSTTTSSTYGFDRWLMSSSDGTTTYSTQTFTPGTAPVSGYEGATFARLVSTGQTLASAESTLQTRLESVRTCAGETVIVSFWAKAATGTPKIAAELRQNFGTGGSPSATLSIPSGSVTIGTTWQRYSITASVTALTGKTIGTTTDGFFSLVLFTSAGSDLNTRASSIGIQSNTFDIWGVQIESASTGSTASPFQTASGSIGGELELCQRYFQTFPSNSTNNAAAIGQFNTTTSARLFRQLPVTMRAAGTATFPTVYTNAIEEVGVAFRTPTAYSSIYAGPDTLMFEATGMSGAVANSMAVYVLSNKISVSAEF